MILSLTIRKNINPYHLFTEPLTLTTLNFSYYPKKYIPNHGGLRMFLQQIKVMSGF